MSKSDRAAPASPHFAKLVREARTEKGMSQRELSRAAGVSAMCINELENHQRIPSLKVAAKIARALKMRVRLADADQECPPPEENSTISA